MKPVDTPQGIEIPPLGLGTYQLEGRSARRVVEEALSLGYRHVDTAEGYDNEHDVGVAVRRSAVPRDRLFLATKVWRAHLRPAGLRKHLQDSLRRLGTDYLDLYLVHWPNSEIAARETVDGLEGLRMEGLIRAWGVSNYTVGHLEEALPHGVPATNQVELHPYFRQPELCSFCLEHRIPVTCYSPLARGGVLDDPVIDELAGTRGRTPAQVVLRWSLQKGRVVIPKASSAEHLRQNLEVREFELSDEEMDLLDARPQEERLFDFSWSEFDR